MIPISKDKIREKLINYVDSHPNVFEDKTGELFKKFIESENICIQDASEIIHDLGTENYVFKDGRVAYHTYPQQVVLSEEYTANLYASKAFHIDAIKCSRKV